MLPEQTSAGRASGGTGGWKPTEIARQMAWRWRDLSVGLYVPLLEFNLLEVTIFPSDQHLKFSTTLCTDHLHRSHSLRWNLRFRRQTQHFPGPRKHPGQPCKFFQHIRTAPQKCRRVEIKLPVNECGRGTPQIRHSIFSRSK